MIPIGNIEEGCIRMRSMKEIGAFVAKTRKAQGVSQLELSQAADTGRRFIVELEGGKDTIRAGDRKSVV